MALVSPPKPWQRSQSDTPQQPPSLSTTTTEQQIQQTATYSSPPASISQPSSFGYNQSSFGNSPSNTYMTSSYGGSGYGGGLHNGMYGGYGGYGCSYGNSYGNTHSPMYNQWGMRPYNSMPFGNQLDAYKGGHPANFLINSGHAVMSGIQQHVSSFGRFSQILHMNLDALQMSFSSVVQLLTNASMLRHELAAFFGAFGSIRAIYLLYLKIRHMILNFLGRRNEARKLEFEGLWKDSGQGRWSWMPTFLTLSLSLLIIRRLIQYLSPRQSGSRQPGTDPIDPSQFWKPSPSDNSRHLMPPYPTPSSPNQPGFNSNNFPQYDPFANNSFQSNFAVPGF